MFLNEYPFVAIFRSVKSITSAFQSILVGPLLLFRTKKSPPSLDIQEETSLWHRCPTVRTPSSHVMRVGESPPLYADCSMIVVSLEFGLPRTRVHRLAWTSVYLRFRFAFVSNVVSDWTVQVYLDADLFLLFDVVFYRRIIIIWG